MGEPCLCTCRGLGLQCIMFEDLGEHNKHTSWACIESVTWLPGTKALKAKSCIWTSKGTVLYAETCKVSGAASLTILVDSVWVCWCGLGVKTLWPSI